MNKVITCHILLFAIIFCFVVGPANAYQPPKRGDENYPEFSPASFDSINARYNSLIAIGDWKGFLYSVERDFFRTDSSSIAEKKALDGFKKAKTKFLLSLGAIQPPANLLAEPKDKSGKTLVTPETPVDSFVSDLLLPRSVTGVFQTFSQGNHWTVFEKGVKSNQSEIDTEVFDLWIGVLLFGPVDFENEIIKNLLLRSGSGGTIPDQEQMRELKVLLKNCDSPMTSAQEDRLKDLFDFAKPDFTQERLDTLFLLSDSIYSILQLAMAPYRQATLKAIQDAQGRWGNYSDTAVANQFPWEMWLNERLGKTGDIERPPGTQTILLHPILAVEFTDPTLEDTWHPLDEATVKETMQVNVLGFSWLDTDGSYQRTFSVSACVSYRSDISIPGYGISIGFKRWVDVGVVHRRISGRNKFSLVFAADLWGLIKKEQSGFVRENVEWLEKAENLLN